MFHHGTICSMGWCVAETPAVRGYVRPDQLAIRTMPSLWYPLGPTSRMRTLRLPLHLPRVTTELTSTDSADASGR